MATWEDVRRLALVLPESAEEPARDGRLAWGVRGKTFAWERPLRPADLEALGDAAPRARSWRPRFPMAAEYLRSGA